MSNFLDELNSYVGGVLDTVNKTNETIDKVLHGNTGPVVDSDPANTPPKTNTGQNAKDAANQSQDHARNAQSSGPGVQFSGGTVALVALAAIVLASMMGD